MAFANKAYNRRIEVSRHAFSHDVSWTLSRQREPDELPMSGPSKPTMLESTGPRNGKALRKRRLFASPTALIAFVLPAAVRSHWRIERGVGRAHP